MKILVLNALRWIYFHLFSWSILFTVYLVAAALLLQPLFENVFRETVSPYFIVGIILTLFGLSVVLSKVPGVIPRVRFRSSPFILNEFRKIQTTLALISILVFGWWFCRDSIFLWVFPIQLVTFRSLFSLSHWQWIYRMRFPSDGASRLFKEYGVFLLVQGVCVSLGALLVVSSWADGFRVSSLIFGSLMSSLAVSFEGDSGRPGLVHLISLTAGIFGGWISYFFPVSLVVILFFVQRMSLVVKDRLKSIEGFDEDHIFL